MSKIRVFDNNLNLPEWVLLQRAADADPQIAIQLYDAFDPATQLPKHHYVRVDSTLTDAQINAALAQPQTQAETNAYAQFVGARAAVKAIPSWATFTEAEALAWIQTNINAPLNTTIPGTLTLATARVVLVWMVGAMKQMAILLTALTRMVIALRNKVI